MERPASPPPSSLSLKNSHQRKYLALTFMQLLISDDFYMVFKPNDNYHLWQCYGNRKERSCQKLSTLKLEKVMPATSIVHSVAVGLTTYSKCCLREGLVCYKIDKIQVAKGIS